eukprot:170434-Amphidinium_carterae.2
MPDTYWSSSAVGAMRAMYIERVATKALSSSWSVLAGKSRLQYYIGRLSLKLKAVLHASFARNASRGVWNQVNAARCITELARGTEDIDAGAGMLSLWLKASYVQGDAQQLHSFALAPVCQFCRGSTRFGYANTRGKLKEVESLEISLCLHISCILGGMLVRYNSWAT